MVKTFLWVGAVAGFALLVSTCVLAYFNWSQKIWTPILSIFLGGTVTVFLTVLALLSGESFERTFLTSVVLSRDNMSAHLTNTNDSPTIDRLREISRLGRPLASNGTGTTRVVIDAPRSDDEAFQYAVEVMQYFIFRKLDPLTRGQSLVSVTNNSISSSVASPAHLSNQTVVSGDDLLRIAHTNRLSAGEWQQRLLKLGAVVVPDGTTIALRQAQGDTRSIVLTKPNFFNMTFAIRPLVMSGPGALPAGVEVDGRREDHRTVQIEVHATAVFERWTAGNTRTEDLKRWANWLLDAVQSASRDE